MNNSYVHVYCHYILIYTNGIIVTFRLNLKLSFLYRLYDSLQTQL